MASRWRRSSAGRPWAEVLVYRPGEHVCTDRFAERLPRSGPDGGPAGPGRGRRGRRLVVPRRAPRQPGRWPIDRIEAAPPPPGSSTSASSPSPIRPSERAPVTVERFDDLALGPWQISQLFAVRWLTCWWPALGLEIRSAGHPLWYRHGRAVPRYAILLNGGAAPGRSPRPAEWVFGPAWSWTFAISATATALGPGERLLALAAAGHRLEAGNIVLLRTGAARAWAPETYPADGAGGLDCDGLHWLVSTRGVRVGRALTAGAWMPCRRGCAATTSERRPGGALALRFRRPRSGPRPDREAHRPRAAARGLASRSSASRSRSPAPAPAGAWVRATSTTGGEP